MRSRCVLQSPPRQGFEETWTERPINRRAHLAACRDRPREIKRQDELVRNDCSPRSILERRYWWSMRPMSNSTRLFAEHVWRRDLFRDAQDAKAAVVRSQSPTTASWFVRRPPPEGSSAPA